MPVKKIKSHLCSGCGVLCNDGYYLTSNRVRSSLWLSQSAYLSFGYGQLCVRGLGLPV